MAAGGQDLAPHDVDPSEPAPPPSDPANLELLGRKSPRQPSSWKASRPSNRLPLRVFCWTRDPGPLACHRRAPARCGTATRSVTTSASTWWSTSPTRRPCWCRTGALCDQARAGPHDAGARLGCWRAGGLGDRGRALRRQPDAARLAGDPKAAVGAGGALHRAASAAGCAAPAGLPLVALVKVAGCRWRVEEVVQAGKGCAAWTTRRCAAGTPGTGG
jgi:hypothetical protein